MAKKKEVYKVKPLNENKENIIRALIEEYDKDKAVSDLLKGFLLGGCCFLVAYSVECLMLYQINQNVSLVFYINGFTLNGETIQHDGFLFLLLCIDLLIL